MRQSYLKNAALMTGADVLLRLAGMGLRIWLANALGGEGMGLYQLVLAVYSLFVTLATAGVSVAATRLMAEELARSPAEARGMLHRLLLAGAGLGVLALAAGLAGLPLARYSRAVTGLRLICRGMLIVGGLLFVNPSLVTDLIGLALIAAEVVLDRLVLSRAQPIAEAA